MHYTTTLTYFALYATCSLVANRNVEDVLLNKNNESFVESKHFNTVNNRQKRSFWEHRKDLITLVSKIGPSMAWRSHGRDNFDLMRNLRRNQIIKSDKVENVMKAVDRGNFVSVKPYHDVPQSIGFGVTISAPHMHAYALELLKDYLKDGEKALDVGSGSGYLTACMAFMVGEKGKAVGIDHIPDLVKQALANIKKTNPELLERVVLECGDGRFGSKTYAPYNAIHVGAATEVIPKALIDQLKPGGRLVVPVGPTQGPQTLTVVDKNLEGVTSFEKLMDVVYVPLTDERTQRSK